MFECKDCGGCTDDNCGGDCGKRWCSGNYMEDTCDQEDE